MDIAGELRIGQSKARTEAIVGYIGGDPERFAALMMVFERGDARMKQCAAWPMSVLAERYPELLCPYLPKLINLLPRKDFHCAVKRNILRILEFVDVPKRLRAKVFSHCADLIADPGEPIAVRCSAITAAARAAGGSVDLLRELRLIASAQLDDASPGMKVRIGRVMAVR